MKLINLFDGSIDDYDVSELTLNYIQSAEFVEFSNLMRDPKRNIRKIMEHLRHIGDELFLDFFHGYTEEQVKQIFINQSEIDKAISMQLDKCETIDTSKFYENTGFECKDCYETFSGDLPDNCPECGGRVYPLINY